MKLAVFVYQQFFHPFLEVVFWEDALDVSGSLFQLLAPSTAGDMPPQVFFLTRGDTSDVS